MSGGKVFICYRREDTAGHSGRIYDRLNARFPGRIFMDVKGIGLGTQWAKEIERVLQTCQVFLVLIGKRWLAMEDDGLRRIDNPRDPLRAEIAAALRLNLRIIPVMIDSPAPTRHELPNDLAPVLDWQALRIQDEDFDHDVGKLVAALESHFNEQPLPSEDRATRGTRVREQVRRLIAEADAAGRRGDWTTAVQLLQSALSLDLDNAEAAAHLRRAREMQVQAPSAPSQPPRPAARGIPKWILASALAVALLLVGIAAYDNTSSVSTYPRSTPYNVPAASPTVPDLSGAYRLVSYTLNGVPQLRSGSMQLTRLGPVRYQFDTFAQNMSGITHQYRGLIEQQGPSWIVQILQSNDPEVGSAPVANQFSFDGSTLGMQNSLGIRAIWRK